MTTTPERLFIRADNIVEYDGMLSNASGQFINNATVAFTLYRRMIGDGVMASGSNILTAASAPFDTADVNRKIMIPGAGEDGADLWTTVASYTDSQTLVLADAASESVSEANVKISLGDAADIDMDYVSGSNGKYQGTLEDTVPLKQDEYYLVVISVDAGGGLKDFRVVDGVAVYRRGVLE